MVAATSPAASRAVLALPESLLLAVHVASSDRPWPPAGDVEADRFLAQAGREGLLPLLFAAAGLPASVARALDRARAHERLAEARAEILTRALHEVEGLMDGEPFVAIKGADYMWRLYARPALRPMQDIDILVPSARIDAVCERLEHGGLRRRPPVRPARAAPSYYERAFLLGDVVVEVHQSFLQRSRHTIDYDAVWARRRPLPSLGPSAARLDDADAVAYHALAMAKDEFTVPLIRFLDLKLMLDAAPDLLPPALARAQEWTAQRAMFGALHLARRLFPGWGGDELGAAEHALLGPLRRRFLARFVLPTDAERGRAGVVTRGRQLWRKFWLMDGPSRRVAFAGEHAAALVLGRRGGRG